MELAKQRDNDSGYAVDMRAVDRSPTNRNRYLPTKENFIRRMNKLLCDLAVQAGPIGDQSSQTNTSPPAG